jgi:hypothetical protein
LMVRVRIACWVHCPFHLAIQWPGEEGRATDDQNDE